MVVLIAGRLSSSADPSGTLLPLVLTDEGRPAAGASRPADNGDPADSGAPSDAPMAALVKLLGSDEV